MDDNSMTSQAIDTLSRIGEIQGVVAEIARLVVKNGLRSDTRYADTVERSHGFMSNALGFLLTAKVILETGDDIRPVAPNVVTQPSTQRPA